MVIDGNITWTRGGNIKIDCYPPDGWYDLPTDT